MPNAPVQASVTSQHRNARWIAYVTLGLTGLLTLFGVYQVGRSPTWDQFVILALFVGLGLTSGLNVWLNRRGRPEASMLLYLWVNLAAYPVVALIVADVGLLLAAVCVVLTSIIASLTISRAHVTRLTVGSLVVGVGVVVLDYYVAMPWRSTVLRPEVMYAFVVALAVIYFAFMVSQMQSFTLRGKLTLAFIGVSLMSVVTVASISGWVNQQLLQQAATHTLEAAADQTVARLDEFLQANSSGIWADAQNPDLAPFLSPANPAAPDPELTQRVAAILRVFSQRNLDKTSSYALLDAQGVDILDTYSPDVGLPKADRDYFQIAMKTSRPYVSAVEFSQTTGKPSLYFSAPVRDAAGNSVGVLRVRFDSSVLQEVIASVYGLAGRESFAVLLDENYIRLADGGSPDDNFKAVAPLSAARVAELQAARRLPAQPSAALSTPLPEFARGLDLAGQQAVFTTPLTSLKGGIATGAVHKLTNQPWYLVVFQPQATFQAAARDQLRLLSMLAILISGLAAGAALIFARLLTAPISRLTNVAARIADGDFTARARVDSADEIGALANNFNAMTAQLRDVIGTLERRVAERTKAVETSAEVSRRLSTITNPQQLILAVVDEIKQAFGYYHAHIYLFDDSRQNLVMAGGTGEAGRTLLSRGHKISKGKGLVGRAAETGKVVLASDTYANPGWLPNELLPETKSEVAVPLIVGERVLGVLDVQHNLVHGLTPADAQLLEAIGRQVAIALQNARAYLQTQQAARRETLVNLIGQKIQGATTVEEVMQIAAIELGTALHASRTSVQLDAPARHAPTRATAAPERPNGGSV